MLKLRPIDRRNQSQPAQFVLQHDSCCHTSDSVPCIWDEALVNSYRQGSLSHWQSRVRSIFGMRTITGTRVATA